MPSYADRTRSDALLRELLAMDESEAVPVGVDPSRLRALGVGLGNTLLEELFCDFVADLEARLARLEALRHEPAGLADAAHALKSCAASFGAIGISEAAAHAERVGRTGSAEGSRAAHAKLQGEMRALLNRVGRQIPA